MRVAGSTVLVLGGAGFIGSHLVDMLVERGVRHVTVVDTLWLGRLENLSHATASGNVIFVKENAEDYSALREVIGRTPYDVVFNLATRPLAYSFHDPRGSYMTSVNIAANLAELLRAQAYGHLVHFSTSEVYGDAVQTPMSETHPLHPTTPYAAGKAAADHLIQSYVTLFDVPVLTVRPFNNYGPRQNDGDYAAVIPLTIRRILASEPPILEGSGTQTRDFTFVRDTARITIQLLECEAAWGQTLNIAAAQEVPIGHLINTIARVMSYTGSILARPVRPGDHRRHLADASSARALVTFDPLTPLDEGLAATVEYFRRRAQPLTTS